MTLTLWDAQSLHALHRDICNSFHSVKLWFGEIMSVKDEDLSAVARQAQCVDEGEQQLRVF